jgi:hypothetical protein
VVAVVAVVAVVSGCDDGGGGECVVVAVEEEEMLETDTYSRGMNAAQTTNRQALWANKHMA